MKITGELLRNLGACECQLKRFEEMFPGGAELTLENCQQVVEAGLGFDWFLRIFEGGAYWEAYWRATEPAWGDFQKAIAPAWENYKKADAPAVEACERAVALALEDYRKAEASALEDYKKAKAPALYDALKQVRGE